MVDKVTQIDKAKYLSAPCTACPLCGNTYVYTEPPEFTGARLTQEMECSECAAQWQEVYTMTDVELIAGGKDSGR